MPTLQEIHAGLKLAASRRVYRAMDFFNPYPKQWEFIRLGATMRERLISAGNQTGKTDIGAYETARHLTGEYPADWPGRKFPGPVRFWMCGKTAGDTRDGVQRKLCGEPGVADKFGTGFIPKEAFVERPTLRHGVSDAFDTMQVKHLQPGGGGTWDGVSIGKLKSYDQGRESHQSDTLHGIWNDEEPPGDIYSEHLPRIRKENGMIFITFTPLKGVTEVVRRYLYEPDPKRAFVKMSIYEVGHYSKDEADEIYNSTPEHERAARCYGDPMLGEGAVFTTLPGELLIPPPPGGIGDVPLHWRKLWGLDYGVGHPFAAVLCGWDEDIDTFYVLHTIKMAGSGKLGHIAAVRGIASEIPVAWPHDMTQRRESGDGDLAKLADQYRNPGAGMPGLNMLPSHATFTTGGYSFSAGILEMQSRMETGRFKVLNTPENELWMQEYRAYHREKGIVVKEFDDALSATRIAVMDLRRGKPMPIGSSTVQRRRARAQIPNNGWDIFTGRPL